MKTRIVAILIICVLMLEGCAVISKNDYTVVSNVRDESEDHYNTLSTPGIINKNDKEDSQSDTDNNQADKDSSGDITSADLNNTEGDNTSDAGKSENGDNIATVDTEGEGMLEDGDVIDGIAENNHDNTDNTSPDDPAAGDIQTGVNDQKADGSDNNTDNEDDKKEGSDKSEEKDKNPGIDNPDAYIFPKDDSDKSYRKEEDIIIPASQIDTYISDFDNVAPSSVMSFNELVGDNGDYELPKGFPEPGTYKIIVDLYYQLVMAFAKDENGDYTVPVRYMLCSSGLSSSPTRTGVFKLKSYRVRFGLFNNTSVYAQYWSQIDGRMYFHSILYTERNAESYNTSFNNLGKKSSHGCVRLSVPDARWIWYNAAPGTTVVIRKGSSDDKVTAKIKELLTLDKMPSSRPKDMTGDDVPYTDNWTIDTVPHEVEFIQGSQDNS